MDLYCTRPGCPRPINVYPDLDNPATLRTVQQKYCTACGMPLILRGRYLPARLLGQGGFGAAFLARDRDMIKLPQRVVKQFLPSGNLNAAQLEIAQNLFEREAEVLAELGNTHPLIPDLFAFFELTVDSLQPGKHDKFFYLVQEFIDGQTMEEILERNGPLSETEVRSMLKEVLEILTFVHEHGSIHRDIKPSNIMQHRNGRFYLLDFGAVKQATKAGTPNKSTGIYSLGFAPPEQVSGGQVYPSTDLYALAVTCLTLLTGKEPNDLFDSYRNTWAWKSHVAQVSPAFAVVLDRMLVASPSQRYQSAADALEALKPRSAPPPVSPPVPPVPSASAPPSPAVPRPPLPTPPAPSPKSAPPASSAPQRPAIAPFSTLELISEAAFTGFEAGLLAIALFSLPIPSVASAGLWLFLSAGLVFAQSRRAIEGKDLPIIAGVTLAIVVGFPLLRSFVATGTNPIVAVLLAATGGNLILAVVALAVFTGLVAVAITTLFRLIYKILSTFL
ncbi:protein kinase [Leptolyngbya sp. FACHB-36]|uniref:bifunctional serine/threonine protein kinase/MFS transporter n=1 Tax=Leptolyngbya sp. FACHB-36 TaxID=2692808 RepID=UPI0016818F27|nr:bifunctional serine/threonine protein kinase/MFS transporter [Leptolyngbya sp. FACHB-36]MBD2019819.1 protein kinase [Leptolyngbya sp. FACHB-36]